MSRPVGSALHKALEQSHELLHRSQPAASATRIDFSPPCPGEAAPARQQLTAPPDINGTAGYWTCSHHLGNWRTEQARTTARSSGGWDARFEWRWVEQCRPRLLPRTSSCRIGQSRSRERNSKLGLPIHGWALRYSPDPAESALPERLRWNRKPLAAGTKP